MAPRGGDWVGTLERFREKRTGNTAAPGTFLYVWLISGAVSCCWGGPASAEQPLDFFFVCFLTDPYWKILLSFRTFSCSSRVELVAL